MKPKTLRLAFLILTCTFLGTPINAQLNINDLDGGSSDGNPINTAVPFLTIAPDGRAAGMGDLGAASIPDISSQHWNVAKYAFMEGKGGLAFTYRPWLSRIIPDFDHFYSSAYYKLNQKSTISASLRYFSLGTQISGPTVPVPIDIYSPHEFAVDVGFSRQLTEDFSGGFALRYIHSDLSGGLFLPGGGTRPGQSLAADIGLYYENDFWIEERDFSWALGMNISNVGTSISYTADDARVPIPTNLRLGGRISRKIGEDHSFSLLADANKYLVPTPGLNGFEIPESILVGMFQSFGDAPGILFPDGTRSSVLREELYEIMISIGAEYWYKDLFAARMGYFHENEYKGNRKYLTFGLSAGWRFLTFDGAYLLPIYGSKSPLANTISLSLALEFKGE